MLKIIRLKIIIRTIKGIYGFDHGFNDGLNIIASNNNTSGKSSIINGLYYALGLEQLIEGSGTGAKTLSQAFTKLIRIDDDINGAELPVLESEVLAEISNGKQVVTIQRFAKHETKKDNLVTIYNSSIEEMYLPTTTSKDMYVLMPGAARNELGFHKFLEDFLSLNLPSVTTTSGSECKLYLQTIFGALFIEQKHGWGGFLNGVPYLGIAEVKKRVVEYILGLSSLEHERARKRQKREEDLILTEWKETCSSIQQIARSSNINVDRLSLSPTLSSDEIFSLSLTKNGQALKAYVSNLNEKAKELISGEPKINIENREKIEVELKHVQKDILDKQMELNKARGMAYTARVNLNRTIESIETIQIDLQNNKEAKRLRELGSQQGIKDFDHLCPTCGQEINDSLLRVKTVMSIEENIAHLQNQEKLLIFSKQGQMKSLDEIEKNIAEIEEALNNLRKLQSVLSGDLVKVKDDYSYAKAYKKVKIDVEIDNINTAIISIKGFQSNLVNLSKRWRMCLDEKKRLGGKNLSDADIQILESLGNEFSELLKDFGYRSTQHFDAIKISEDTFLPTINGFDMRYDSSASDELRNIWAFTLALLDISFKYNGNHPKILIYDEPKQQSVIDESFKVLCDKLLALSETQVILGVTAADNGVKKVIEGLKNVNLINIENRAFKLLNHAQ